jgi:hypothetical protein
MSEQNVTRREAVKLGGAALAAVGLSAGASAVAPEPAPGVDFPDFRGKTVLLYTCGNSTQLLTDPVFAMQAGRLFLTGRTPALGYWPDGLLAAVAWDSVDRYFIFDSADDCQARWKYHTSHKEATAEATAHGNRPSQ